MGSCSLTTELTRAAPVSPSIASRLAPFVIRTGARCTGSLCLPRIKPRDNVGPNWHVRAEGSNGNNRGPIVCDCPHPMVFIAKRRVGEQRVELRLSRGIQGASRKGEVPLLKVAKFHKGLTMFILLAEGLFQGGSSTQIPAPNSWVKVKPQTGWSRPSPGQWSWPRAIQGTHAIQVV